MLTAALPVAVAVAVALVAPVCRLVVRARARGLVVDERAAPDAHAAIVLGAGLTPSGRPGRVLTDRVHAGARLWLIGRVETLVMSGAHDANGDQPGAMADLAIALGVDPDRIVCDRTGVDTAATCRFTRAAYGPRALLFVTQAFHAPRTAYLARKAGLAATVVAVDDSRLPPRPLAAARAREIPAAVKATLVDRF